MERKPYLTFPDVVRQHFAEDTSHQNIFRDDLVTKDVLNLLSIIKKDFNDEPVIIQHCMTHKHFGYFYAILSKDGKRIKLCPSSYRRGSIPECGGYLTCIEQFYHQEILNFFLRMVKYSLLEEADVEMKLKQANMGLLLRNISEDMPDRLKAVFDDWRSQIDLNELRKITIPSVTEEQREKFIMRLDEDELYYNSIVIGNKMIIPTFSHNMDKPLIYLVKDGVLVDEHWYSKADDYSINEEPELEDFSDIFKKQ